MADQGWYEANFAHFWSLAVDEQFYLCWPWPLYSFLDNNCSPPFCRLFLLASLPLVLRPLALREHDAFVHLHLDSHFAGEPGLVHRWPVVVQRDRAPQLRRWLTFL